MGGLYPITSIVVGEKHNFGGAMEQCSSASAPVDVCLVLLWLWICTLIGFILTLSGSLINLMNHFLSKQEEKWYIYNIFANIFIINSKWQVIMGCY